MATVEVGVLIVLAVGQVSFLLDLDFFGFICSSLLGERIYPTGYCPIDRGSEVPTA